MKKDSAFKLKSGNKPSIAKLIGLFKTKPVKKAKAVKTTKSKTVSYRQAYDKMSAKAKGRFKDYADFEKQAKAYNRKKYGTTSPSAKAKKSGITKEQLSNRATRNVGYRKNEGFGGKARRK